MQGQFDVVDNAHRIDQGTVLKRHAHLFAQCKQRFSSAGMQVTAEHIYFPGIGRRQAEDVSQQGRFAGATRAHDDEDLTGSNPKINVGENLVIAVRRR